MASWRSSSRSGNENVEAVEVKVITKTSVSVLFLYWMRILLINTVFQVVYKTVVWSPEVNDGSIVNMCLLGIIIALSVLYIPKWNRVSRYVCFGIAIIISDLFVSWVYPLRYTLNVRSVGSLCVEAQFKVYDYISLSWMALFVVVFAAILKLIIFAGMRLCKMGRRALINRFKQPV